MKEMVNKFKEKLKNDSVIGVFSKTCDPAFIECMGFSGMDFVILDLEHGPNSVQSVQNLVRAAKISGVLPIVRVKEDNFSVMNEVLDIGAGGIQVPQITCKEDALKVKEITKFAPVGMRGVCRFVRAADYSCKDRFQYFEEANKTITVLQVEGKTGIDNLQEILDADLADVLFIGPYDLSQSLGVPGEIDHPKVEEAMLDIVKQCKERGVAVGVFTDTIKNARKWKEKGVKYIAHSVDVGLFCDVIKSTIKDINE